MPICAERRPFGVSEYCTRTASTYGEAGAACKQGEQPDIRYPRHKCCLCRVRMCGPGGVGSRWWSISCGVDVLGVRTLVNRGPCGKGRCQATILGGRLSSGSACGVKLKKRMQNRVHQKNSATESAWMAALTDFLLHASRPGLETWLRELPFFHAESSASVSVCSLSLSL
jgi:hypothetical protein